MGGGYPHPIQTWDVAPPPKDGCTPTPASVDRQTLPSINITFPHTSYAGGKNLSVNIKMGRPRPVGLKWVPVHYQQFGGGGEGPKSKTDRIPKSHILKGRVLTPPPESEE